MPDQVFDFDSGFGEAYDSFVRQTIFGYEQIFTQVLALLKNRLSDEAELLVAGCGTGKELVTFGTQVPRWQFTGYDPSAQMVSITSANLARHGLNDRVTLFQGFASDLPKEKTFDATTLILVLHFIPDAAGKLALLKELAARIKEGGYLVYLSHHGDQTDPEFMTRLNDWRAFMLLNGVSAEKAENVLNTALNGGQFSPENEVFKLLAEAGFGDIQPFYRAFLSSGWLARKI